MCSQQWLAVVFWRESLGLPFSLPDHETVLASVPCWNVPCVGWSTQCSVLFALDADAIQQACVCQLELLCSLRVSCYCTETTILKKSLRCDWKVANEVSLVKSFFDQIICKPEYYKIHNILVHVQNKKFDGIVSWLKVVPHWPSNLQDSSRMRRCHLWGTNWSVCIFSCGNRNQHLSTLS